MRIIVPGAGPSSPRIAIVGEAPGAEEVKKGAPFVGASGGVLKGMFRQLGMDYEECYRTNVVKERPPGNDFSAFCCKKKEAEEAYKEHLPHLRQRFPRFDWPDEYLFPKASTQDKGYIHPQYLDSLPVLQEELRERNPNIVLALGNAACWALLGQVGITKLRGALAQGLLIDTKVLPSLHPAAIMRQYQLRPIGLADLMKLKDEARSPDIHFPEREIWTEPDLADLAAFDEYLREAEVLSVDIETLPSRRLITEVGIAPSPDRAIVVPFLDKSRSDYCYWRSHNAQVAATEWLRHWLEGPKPKVLQNGTYDLIWLWWVFGIRIKNFVHDTMIKQHAKYLELPKDLGFLSSVYTNSPEYKTLRTTTNKEND